MAYASSRSSREKFEQDVGVDPVTKVIGVIDAIAREVVEAFPLPQIAPHAGAVRDSNPLALQLQKLIAEIVAMPASQGERLKKILE